MCSTEEAGASFCSNLSAAAFTWPGQSFHMARAVLSPTGGGTLFHVLNAPLLTGISSGPFKNGSHYFGASLAPAHCQEPKVLTRGGNKIFVDS